MLARILTFSLGWIFFYSGFLILSMPIQRGHLLTAVALSGILIGIFLMWSFFIILIGDKHNDKSDDI